jgi:Tetratricopeptide repeat
VAAAAAPAPPAKGKKGKGKKASAPAANAKPEAPAKPVADEIDLTGALDALARGVSLGDVLDEADPNGASAHADDDADDGDDDNGHADVAGATTHATPTPSEHGEHGDADTTAFVADSIVGAGGQVTQANGAADDVDLEQVFDGLRAEAADDMVEMTQPDLSARLLSMAETYQAAGMFEEARAALEQVSSDSRYRFRAAAALGQLFWQQGDPDGALRWLELASEAPAPDPDTGRAVMYDFGEKLEQTGDTTRALAVFLDLLAEQGDYRDVRERVDRLTRVQAG